MTRIDQLRVRPAVNLSWRVIWAAIWQSALTILYGFGCLAASAMALYVALGGGFLLASAALGFAAFAALGRMIETGIIAWKRIRATGVL